MTLTAVRREKAALSCGCKSHLAKLGIAAGKLTAVPCIFSAGHRETGYWLRVFQLGRICLSSSENAHF